MLSHLRANLFLLALTLLLCSVVYPLTLWGLGRLPLFRRQADGSLLPGSNHQPVGSKLIGQAFTGKEFFQPRPSATSPSPYNAMASGGSNLAANNPKLRGRVAQQLGLIVRHLSLEGPGKGALVGDDVQKWFQDENDPAKQEQRRDLTAEWAARNPSLVAGWATGSDELKEFITQWAKDHAGIRGAWQLSQWKAAHPDAKAQPGERDLAKLKLDDAKPEDLAPLLFDTDIADSFVKLHPGKWPCTVEEEKDGKTVNVIKADNKGDDVKSYFFDMWLQDHRDAKLEPVPADLVMASASGLDPHITLKNALYQLRTRIAAAQADKLVTDRVEQMIKNVKEKPSEARRKELAEQALKELTAKAGKPLEDRVRELIEGLLKEKQAAPFNGLAGVPLINVLDVNLALPERLKQLTL